MMISNEFIEKHNIVLRMFTDSNCQHPVIPASLNRDGTISWVMPGGERVYNKRVAERRAKQLYRSLGYRDGRDRV